MHHTIETGICSQVKAESDACFGLLRVSSLHLEKNGIIEITPTAAKCTPSLFLPQSAPHNQISGGENSVPLNRSALPPSQKIPTPSRCGREGQSQNHRRACQMPLHRERGYAGLYCICLRQVVAIASCYNIISVSSRICARC